MYKILIPVWKKLENNIFLENIFCNLADKPQLKWEEIKFGVIWGLKSNIFHKTKLVKLHEDKNSNATFALKV